MPIRPFALLAFLPLAACSAAASDNAVQKFSFDELQAQAAPVISASPDATDAVWMAAADHTHSLRFGRPNEAPMLTLTCETQSKATPIIHIVRNATGEPGAKALFPLLGSNMNARIAAETRMRDGKWIWESEVPALDPQLDVFLPGNAVEATLPGGGTLKLAASKEPARVIAACRHQTGAELVSAEPAPQA